MTDADCFLDHLVAHARVGRAIDTLAKPARALTPQ